MFLRTSILTNTLLQPKANMRKLFLCAFLGVLSNFLLKSEAQVICKQRPVDVVFLLDGSRSVRPRNFKTIKEYVKNFTKTFDEIGPTGAQIGVVQFASKVREEVRLNQYKNRRKLFKAIDRIRYMKMGTMTGEALKFLVTKSLTPSHGARVDNPDVHTVALVITDGKSQDYHRGTLTIWQHKAKQLGVELYGIGIGKKTNDNELLEIASEPKEEHKFHTDDFEGIKTISLQLHNLEVCDEDECLEENICDQICNNTIGSYACECNRGYELRSDRRTCQPLIPPTPTNLRTTAVTHTTSEIQWDLPNEADADLIDHYVVTYARADGVGEEIVLRVFGNQAVELTNLDPSAEYDVSVSCVNANGLSSPIRGTFATLSLGRTTLTLSNPTITTLTAQWTPAIGDGLTGYKVLYQKVEEINGSHDDNTTESKVFEVLCPPNTQEITLTGLEPGTSYSVEVIPLHGQLEGGTDSAERSTASLVEAEVTISDTSLCGVTATWQTLPHEVTGWSVSIFEEKGDLVESRNEPANRLTTTFENLRPSKLYTVKLYARVTEGGKDFITPVANSTGRTKALSAPVVKVPERTTSSITIEWSDINFQASSWTVKVFPKGEKRKFKLKEVSGDINTIVMDDLSPSTLYKVEVHGQVAEGRSVLLSPKGKSKGRTRPLKSPVVKCKAASESSITVQWNGINVEVDSWTVGLYPQTVRSYNETFQQDADEQEYEFLQLRPATTYTVEVVGNVVVDDSDQNVSAKGRTTCMTNPAAPRNIKVIERGVDNLVIAFDVPPGDVDSYEGQCISQDRDSPQLVKGVFISDSIMQCSNLDPAISYDINLISVYRNRTSKLTSASNTTLTPQTSGFVLQEPTTHSMRAEWNAPDVGDVDFYHVTYNSSLEDVEVRIVNGGQTSMLLTDLDPNTEYWVKVQAEMNDEQSTPEVAIASTLQDDFNLHIDGVGYTTINVSWTASSVPHLQSYCLRYSPAYLPQYENDLKLSADTLSHSLTNLETATEYKIALNARYAKSQSDEREKFATTLALPPIGPLSFSDVTESSFVAHWLPPEGNPYPVSYIVTYFAGEMTAITVEDVKTPYLLIEELVANTTYNVTVVACYPEDLISQPVQGNETTLSSVQAQCSCDTYLKAQSNMQSTLTEMMRQINDLTNTIGELKSSLSRNTRSSYGIRSRRSLDPYHH